MHSNNIADNSRNDNAAITHKRPSAAGAVGATACWACTIAILLLAGLDVPGYIVGGLAGVLIITGFFAHPLRSGLSPAIVQLIPFWGIVARRDRINTCRRLRTAEIYTTGDTAATIPATTSCTRGTHGSRTYTVAFNGSGQANMGPDRIRRQLELNCRVWGCRSFAFQEDDKHPGRYTIQLSTSDHVRTVLDSPILGIADAEADHRIDGWEAWDDLGIDK